MYREMGGRNFCFFKDKRSRLLYFKKKIIVTSQTKVSYTPFVLNYKLFWLFYLYEKMQLILYGKDVEAKSLINFKDNKPL